MTEDTKTQADPCEEKDQQTAILDMMAEMNAKIDMLVRTMANFNKNLTIVAAVAEPSFEKMMMEEREKKKKESEDKRLEFKALYESVEHSFYPMITSPSDRVITINCVKYDGYIMVDRLTGNYAMKYHPEDEDEFLEDANKYLSERPNLFVNRMEWPLKLYSAPGVDRESLLKISVKEKEEKE